MTPWWRDVACIFVYSFKSTERDTVGLRFSTHLVLCVLLAPVVLYVFLVTSVHIIIDLMAVTLNSSSAPRTCWTV